MTDINMSPWVIYLAFPVLVLLTWAAISGLIAFVRNLKKKVDTACDENSRNALKLTFLEQEFRELKRQFEKQEKIPESIARFEGDIKTLFSQMSTMDGKLDKLLDNMIIGGKK